MKRGICYMLFAFAAALGLSVTASAQTAQKTTAKPAAKQVAQQPAAKKGQPKTANGQPVILMEEEDTEIMYGKSGNKNVMVINRHEDIIMEQLEPTLSPAKHKQRFAAAATVAESDMTSFMDGYYDFKNKVNDEIGLQFGFDASFLAQRAAPSGKQTAVQAMYYPYATWNLFKDTAIGSGQIDFNYNLVRYWGQEAEVLQDRVNVVNGINDYTTRSNLFSQASYTHTLPGEFDWLSITLGQFPIYNFDGTTYDDNQQVGLMNYALSQNATASYPLASLGAYLQAQVGKFTVAAGYQDANNVTGSRVNFKTAFDGQYTGFAYAGYAPDSNSLYSVLAYYQPSVTEQEGNSTGVSLNMQQNIGKKWVLFGRANAVNHNILPIKQSYVLGTSFVNPLDRNPLDAITFGVAYNRLSGEGLGYPEFYRTGEAVAELQWVWGVGKYLTVTPDVQVFPRAGLTADDGIVTVVGLRSTLMF